MHAKVYIIHDIAKWKPCQNGTCWNVKWLIISDVMVGNVSRVSTLLHSLPFLLIFALTISSNDCHLHFINLWRCDCV